MKKNILLILTVAALSALATWAIQSSLRAEDPFADDKALLDRAMAKEKEDNIDAAELMYRDILKNNPRNTQALLRLAVLLHLERNDYQSAIHYYTSYLDIAPESDFAPTVKERLASATADLRAQWLKADIARTQANLLAELESLKEERSTLKETLRTQRDTLADKDKEIKDLLRRIENLNRMVEEMKGLDVKSPALPQHDFEAIKNIDLVPSQAQAVPSQESLLDASDTDAEIAGIRDLANRMIQEEDGGQAQINEATRLAVEGKSDTENIIATPTPGKPYVVRPGETYYSIAKDAYGSSAYWAKIRDANRGATNPNDRLLAGETILIPEL